MRRSLGTALWSLVGLLSCFLGALSALLGTVPGRTLLTRAFAGSLAGAVAGRVEIGDIGGSLFTGVRLRDVRLYDHDSTIVAWLPEAEFEYNPFDFAAGRAVLQEVRLVRPQFNLVQHVNGRLNLEELLRLGERDTTDTRPRGPAPLILLRNVTVTGGSLVLRLQDQATPDDALLEIDEFGNDGRRRIRRFDSLEMNLAALRISAPRTPGILVEINNLSVVMSDPAIKIRGAAGTATIVGDSMDLDLSRLGLPESQLAVTGQVTWPDGPILYDLDVVADSANLADLSWIDPRFTEAARVRGAAAVRSSANGVLVVRLDPIEIRHHGGRLAGKLTTISVADSGLVRIRDGDLESMNVDLELVRPLLDTLPFAGRLTGRTVVSGPIDSLSLDVDWWYRDSLVLGWPETRLRGRGVVDLRDAEGIAFRPFALDTATIDLGSLRRLIPALTLQGTLDGTGSLEGPYINARWTGTLRHRDGAAPASLVRGTFRLDARRDTLGVSVDVIADTLALAGLHSSFPGLTLTVPLSGPIRMEGTIADAATHADLVALEGGGTIRLDGRLTLLNPPLGARELTLVASDVDLRTWLDGAPHTRLSFIATGDVHADSGTAPEGALRIQMAPSFVAGSAIDSGTAAVRFADGLLRLDSLRIEQLGLRVAGSGAIGWNAPRGEQLEITIEADSLGALDSLATWITNTVWTSGDSLTGLMGAAKVEGTLSGALDSLLIDARAEVARLRWRTLNVPAGRGRLKWHTGTEQLSISADVDSIAYDGHGFGGVAASAEGPVDSLSWFGRGRVGDGLAVLAGGSLARGPDLTVARLDSAAALLPGEVWLLQHPGEIRVTTAAVTFVDSGLVLRRGDGDSGVVWLSGIVPLDSAGSMRLTVRRFPLAAIAAFIANDTTGVRGRMSADLALSGSRRNPVMEASFEAAGDPGIGTPFRARGVATYAARRLDADIKVNRRGRQILDVTAHVPIDLALENVPRRPGSDTLWVRAVADSIDLSQLGLLDAFSTGVIGRFSTDLVLRGTWEAPVLAGHAELMGAGANLQSLRVRYEDVNGRFTFAGDTIRVDSLRLRSGQGTLSVAGFVRLERLSRPILALDLSARDFHATELRNYLSVTASGEVALRGPVLGATLTGHGTVGSGFLYFADLISKRVVNLDEPWVATLITPEELRRQDIDRGFHNRFLDSLRIRDLSLAMGSDVWLRSNEANIQLTGTVNVSKQANNYLLSGTLQAPRGTYRLVVGTVLSREFIVTEGTVRYFGTADLNAELNINAKHVVRATGDQTEDIPITAHIGGTLLVPRLRLSIEGQQVSQTEIISYLVLGRQPSALGGSTASGQEADLLMSTVGNIVSGELERTLVSDLGIPLDYIEIRAGGLRPGDEPGQNRWSGALVAAGWQIGSRTFLTLNAGFCDIQNLTNVSKTLGATLQFRFSPEWRTEASFEPVRNCNKAAQTTGELQLGLDLLWERRF